mmetsp:Transcript_48459/g.98671  ORF Transcript_48459/g.98671 Transcript_48459/m.98671 type:complete len:142 (-) Transcript_48459:741-1166(-)
MFCRNLFHRRYRRCFSREYFFCQQQWPVGKDAYIYDGRDGCESRFSRIGFVGRAYQYLESPHTGDKTLPFFESADAGCSGPQRAGRHTTNSTEETQAGQARQASHTDPPPTAKAAYQPWLGECAVGRPAASERSALEAAHS